MGSDPDKNEKTLEIPFPESPESTISSPCLGENQMPEISIWMGPKPEVKKGSFELLVWSGFEDYSCSSQGSTNLIFFSQFRCSPHITR